MHVLHLYIVKVLGCGESEGARWPARAQRRPLVNHNCTVDPEPHTLRGGVASIGERSDETGLEDIGQGFTRVEQDTGVGRLSTTIWFDRT